MAGLYIHIPFCASKCAYCDFYSLGTPHNGFLDALEREMVSRRDFFHPRLSIVNYPLSTIYVGGGTPSLLTPAELGRILNKASELWDCSGLQEVTVEANPEDLTDEYLAELFAVMPVSPRLSIGVQSFDDGLLRLMNRRHSAQRARDAVRAAQRAGFTNISIDLIFGIPGMTTAQWQHTLNEAVSLGVQHISAYHLTIEPGTLFGRMMRDNEQNNSPSAFRPIPESESERQFEMLRRSLSEAGFDHYEISNFALPGRRAVHNSAYWSGAPYLGIGPAAHSYDGARTRSRVVADVGKYIATPEAIYETETLSDTDLYNERVMTGLRRAEGITLEELRVTNYELRATLERFLAGGLLVMKDKNDPQNIEIPGENPSNSGEPGAKTISIPPEKWLLSDYIIGSLFE